MAIARLTTIKRADGSTRQVFQAFYKESQVEDVALESGESVEFSLESSTWISRVIDGIPDPLPEDLKAEMLAINEAYTRGEFVDITDKLN